MLKIKTVEFTDGEKFKVQEDIVTKEFGCLDKNFKGYFFEWHYIYHNGYAGLKPLVFNEDKKAVREFSDWASKTLCIDMKLFLPDGNFIVQELNVNLNNEKLNIEAIKSGELVYNHYLIKENNGKYELQKLYQWADEIKRDFIYTKTGSIQIIDANGKESDYDYLSNIEYKANPFLLEKIIIPKQ